MDAVLDGGFAEPVFASQSVFRAVMNALANPGKPQDLLTPPLIQNSLSLELASALLTLTDHDTRVWLDEPLAADRAVEDFVNFHSGAPIVADPSQAMFAFVSGFEHLPRLDRFNLGTQEYPDRSTTIVLAVPALDGGPELMVRGPGINDHWHCSPRGLAADFVAQWGDNRALFPRGIDLLLVAPGAVMGLPRSTRIEGEH